MQVFEPGDCVYYLITRASLGMTEKLRHELKAAGVGYVRPGYLGALLGLHGREGLKSGELGRYAGLEPSTMTNLLDRMCHNGFVVRRDDPKDRRAQRIYLTDKGRQVVEPMMTAVERALSHALEGISRSNQEIVRDALRRILKNTGRLVDP